VDKLFELHSFSNVHHLVSSISARLDREHSPLDLLRSCFPGGSITGAPKRRAMQIIEELEPDGRAVYCGAIGYIGFDGRMDSNITIRTLLCEAPDILCWGGGGIVADSVWSAEYQECYDKINNLIKALY
jgi:para-aminobenzoate synthetase component 1